MPSIDSDTDRESHREGRRQRTADGIEILTVAAFLEELENATLLEPTDS